MDFKKRFPLDTFKKDVVKLMDFKDSIVNQSYLIYPKLAKIALKENIALLIFDNDTIKVKGISGNDLWLTKHQDFENFNMLFDKAKFGDNCGFEICFPFSKTTVSNDYLNSNKTKIEPSMDWWYGINQKSHLNNSCERIKTPFQF